MNISHNPIFILGLMPRSGTNFLSNLLQLHPECGPADPVWEDYLVSHLDSLAHFTDSVAAEWDDDWGVDAQVQSDLDHALGNGMATFLEDRCQARRVISKAPRIDNLGLFYRFFPGCSLLILVRDGRSIVESGARTFGWSREAATHLVAEAARKVSAFQRTATGQQSFRVIRYEDLWLDTERELRELFEFLGLDSDIYDWQQALALPVRGSSELKNTKDSSVHWDPIERSEDFDPMSRFDHWDDALHARYDHVAGAAMEPFNYRAGLAGGTPLHLRLRNLAMDAAWSLRVALRPLYRRFRNRQKSIS